MTALAGVFYALFLLYAVARLFRKSASGAVEFIVASRGLTLPAFTASLVTTWYGGILGVGEYTFSHGISNWLVFGVPYYLYAGIFAMFLAARARRSEVLTMPDILEKQFGRPAALAGAGMMFIMTVPAAYVLMLGVLLNFATGWPLWVGVILGTALSVSYVFRGGLKAVVATDIVQFFLMFLGFVVLVPVCISRFGGWEFLQNNLPASHLRWDGGLGVQAIAVWYFIALSTLVEPAFYQRCYAAKTEKTARWGIVAAIGLWMFFDFLTTTAGLYARALLPDLANPVQAFPALAAHVLHPFWQGVFTVALLATIMSTVDSYAFICAVTLGRDVVSRWRGELSSNQQPEQQSKPSENSLPLIRVSLGVTAVLAVVMALWAESVISLWKILGSLGTPVLLGPMLLAQWGKRLPGFGVAVVMLASGLTSGVWLILGHAEPWLGIEAIFPGLFVSGLGLGLVKHLSE
ncbi:MAG: sodium:solute symporter family protein [bacterium]|nr:sodium:solute symporter family protein [bacterium]